MANRALRALWVGAFLGASVPRAASAQHAPAGEVTATEGADETGEGDDIRVRARARRDGCVHWDGPEGPHGLPATTLDAGATRVRFTVFNDQRRGGPHAWARENPRARVEDVVRHSMLAVMRSAVREAETRFPAFATTTRAGMVNGVVGAQATFRSRRPVPYLGNVAESVSLEVRQCPVSYVLPSDYGGVPCVGRRIQLLVGPPSGWASAFVHAMVLDQCFQGSGQDIAVRRAWAVSGAVRSVPFVSTQVLQTELRYWTGAVLERLASGVNEEAHLRVNPYTSRRRDEELPSSADASLPVPSACVAPIAGATRMYYALEGALRQGTDPWNADLDAVLDRVRGAFSSDELGALASVRSRAAEPLFDGYAQRLEALVRSSLRRSAGRELARFDRPGAPPVVQASAVRAEPVRPLSRLEAYRERMRLMALPPTAAIGYSAAVVERDPDVAMASGIALRLCRTEQLDLPAERGRDRVRRTRYTTCSLLRFDPAPRIEHTGWLAEPMEPGHTDLGLGRVVRGGVHATGRVEFVREMLGVRGLPECAAFVRDLRWADEPRTRTAR